MSLTLTPAANASPFPVRPRRAVRASRLATSLSLAFASVLAATALLTGAGMTLPSLSPLASALTWVSLPLAGAAGAMYVLSDQRRLRVERRSERAQATAALGAVSGIALAVTAGTLGAGPLPGLAASALAPLATFPMALAMASPALAAGMDRRAPRSFGAAALSLPVPLAAWSLFPYVVASTLGLFASASVAILGAGLAHAWTLREIAPAARTRSASFIDGDLARRLKGVEARERSVKAREAAIATRERRVAEAPASPVLPAAVPVPPVSAPTAENARVAEELAAERARLSTEAVRLRQLQEEVELQQEEVAARGAERERLENELKAREQSLRHRETELEAFEQQLSHQMTEIHAQSERLTEMQKELEQRLAMAQERTAGTAEVPTPRTPPEEPKSRSRSLRERALKEREAELLEKAAQLVEREKYLESWAMKVEAKAREGKHEREYVDTLARSVKGTSLQMRGYLDAVARKEASFRRREDELQGALTGLEALRATVNESLGRVGVLQREIQTRQQVLVQREGEQQAREEALQQREMEFTSLAASLAGGQVRADRVLDLRERLLRQREEEFGKRAYEKEKQLENQRRAVREQVLVAAAAASGQELVVPAAPAGARAHTGIPRFDELLAGGIPWKSTFLVVGPAFVGKQVFVGRFLAEGFRHREPTILVTTARPPVEVTEEMAGVDPSFTEADRSGLVYWIDASARTDSPGRPQRDMNRLRVDGAGDLKGIYEAILQLETELNSRRIQRFRFAYIALSQSLMHARETDPTEFFQMLTNRLRRTQHVGLYLVETGILTDRQQQVLEHLCDGSVVFRKETARNYLAVQGFTDVLTRDWVPYQFTRQTLHLGAFNLNRIK